MDSKKVQVIVVDDGRPVVPQLVPITILWVEADRAYRVTLAVTLGTTITAALLSVLGMTPQAILWAVLVGPLAQTILRAYVRWKTRQELDKMRKLLGID